MRLRVHFGRDRVLEEVLPTTELVGAYLGALVAYPAYDEAPKREIAAVIIAARMAQDRLGTSKSQEAGCERDALLLEMIRSQSGAALEKRLQRRVQAAEVVWRMTGAVGEEMPARMVATSLAEGLAKTASAFGSENADNFEARVWNPSLPVIHLLCAYWQLTFPKRCAGEDHSLLQQLSSQPFLERWISVATSVQPLLANLWPKRTARLPLVDVEIDWAPQNTKVTPARGDTI